MRMPLFYSKLLSWVVSDRLYTLPPPVFLGQDSTNSLVHIPLLFSFSPSTSGPVSLSPPIHPFPPVDVFAVVTRVDPIDCGAQRHLGAIFKHPVMVLTYLVVLTNLILVLTYLIEVLTH